MGRVLFLLFALIVLPAVCVSATDGGALARADEAFAQSRFADAVELYREAQAELADAEPEQRALAFRGETRSLRRSGASLEAVPLEERNLAFARANKLELFEFRALAGLALDYSYLGQYDDGVEKRLEAQAIAERRGDTNGAANMIYGLANLYRLQNRFLLAFEAYQTALNRFEQDQHIQKLNVRIAVALLFDGIDDNEAMLNAILEAHDKQSLGHSKGQAADIQRLTGKAYLKLGQLDAAESHLQAALELERQMQREEAAYIHLYLANLESAKGNPEAAIALAEKSLETTARGNLPSTRALALAQRGQSRLHLGHADAALDDMQTALDLAEQVGDRVIVRKVVDMLATANASLGNYREAYELALKARQLVRTTGRAGLGRQVAEITAQQREALADARIANLSQANTIAQLNLKQRDLLLATLALAILLATLGVVFLLVRMRAIRRHANVDALTGLMSRRYFFNALDAQHAEAASQGVEQAVAIIDVDHFKKVNDTYGHPTGDEVLRQMAKILSACLPEDAVCGRMGGEEFAAAVQSRSGTALTSACEQFLAALRHEAFQDRDGRSFHVTASIGVIQQPAAEFSVKELIDQADAALYRAKELGRDRMEATSRGTEHRRPG